MIRLSNVGVQSLELVAALNGAAFACGFNDESATAYVGSSNYGLAAAAGTYTIVAVPAPGSIRDIDHINIKNTFAGSHAVVVQVNANGTTVPLVSVVLEINESLNYTHGSGWQVKEASGATKVTASTGGGGATSLNDLTDVSVAVPTGGQVLAYNTATSRWENAEGVAGKTDMTGFPVDVSGNYLCSLTYNETTRTVTLTPTGADFDVFSMGTKYTKVGAQSIAHSAVGASQFVYYDETGTLVTGTAPWDLLKHAPVCFIFQDVTNSLRIPFEERHHAGRDVYWHRNQHAAEGTKATGSGFQVTGYTLNGPTDAECTYAIATGRVEDEDIRVDTEALPDAGPYTIMERVGASGDWQITRGNAVPFFRAGTNIRYNQNTGATWQRTALANNDYVNYYILGLTALPVANISPALATTQQYVVVPGQAKFASAALASAETIASLAWGSAPFQEMVPLYKVTMLYQSGGGGTVRITALTRIIGTSASIAAATQTDHGALTGLNDQDHPATAIINTPAGNLVATDVQAAINELDTEKAGLALANTFTANQIIEVTDNTNAALRVTQTGTGHALLLEDSANPDSTPFIITASGNVVMGTTSVPAGVQHLISGLITGASISGAMKVASQVQADVTSNSYSFESSPSIIAAGNSNYYHYKVANVSKGAGATCNLQVGVHVADLSSGTTNYGALLQISGSGSGGVGDYNLYCEGGAPNFMQGNLGIGTSTSDTKLTISPQNGQAAVEIIPNGMASSPPAGSIEYDGYAFYGSTGVNGSPKARGAFTTEQFVILTATNTLISQTAAQALFDGGVGPATGAVFLDEGIYKFTCDFALSGMSASSGSFGFALGGTATKTQAWTSDAKKATLATAAATQNTYNTTAANVALATASVATVGNTQIEGILRVTVAGTVIPQVSLGVAAAAVVAINSNFRVSPLGSSTVASSGDWS